MTRQAGGCQNLKGLDIGSQAPATRMTRHTHERRGKKVDPVAYAYADLNATQTDACDLAIDVFARYLTHLGNTNKAEWDDPIPVTREMILEDEGAHLVHEATYPHRFAQEHVYVFLLDPFKDEGGPSQVMLFFRNYGSMPEVLNAVLWEFDTTYEVIPQEWWAANVGQEVRA